METMIKDDEKPMTNVMINHVGVSVVVVIHDDWMVQRHDDWETFSWIKALEVMV